MKKALLAVLVLLALCATLAGCGQENLSGAIYAPNAVPAVTENF